jgi:hypothetical protein
MRSPVVVTALVLALAGLRAAANDEKKSEGIEKKVTDIVKQVGDLHKNAKSLHVDATVVTDAESGDQKRQIKSEAVFDMERPNHFAARTKIDGKADTGRDLVNDGKKLYVYDKGLKQYTQDDAEDMPGVGTAVLRQLRTPATGILFQNVLAEDPYEALMDGVTDATYGGEVTVDGKKAHHLKFEQPGMHWELWVAAEGKPWVLKALSQRENDNGKMVTVETYKNWKLDESPSKDAFAFSPTEQAKKVDEFSAGE